MDISLKYQDLYWILSMLSEEYEQNGNVDFSELNTYIEQLINGTESCLNNTNKNELSDLEFYQNILKVAEITNWTELDCYRVIELKEKQKFPHEGIIKTTMHTSYIKQEGNGRDFSYYEEEIGIDFKIIYAKDALIDFNHVYTVEEIKKLIEDKKIVLISELERKYKLNKEYKKEEYQQLECAYSDYNRKYQFLNRKGKFYPYTIKYIKNIIDKKHLIELFKKQLKHTNEQISMVINPKIWNYDDLEVIAQLYKKEYEKQDFARRLKNLNQTK